MSSWSEAEVTPLVTPELRTGIWTRFGDAAVLGDAVTERALSALAETTRTAARSQGYSVGWAEGQRAARAEAEAEAAQVAATRHAEDQLRRAEHAAAVAALRAAAERLEDELDRACAAVADAAAGLAWELTRTIVGTAVTEVDAVRRALELAPSGGTARIVLHPADAAAVDTETAAALAERGIDMVVDAGLDRGDALVEAEDHVLDLRISTALERVREVLR